MQFRKIWMILMIKLRILNLNLALINLKYVLILNCLYNMMQILLRIWKKLMRHQFTVLMILSSLSQSNNLILKLKNINLFSYLRFQLMILFSKKNSQDQDVNMKVQLDKEQVNLILKRYKLLLMNRWNY